MFFNLPNFSLLFCEKFFRTLFFFAPRVPMLFVSILLPDCGCKVTANFSNFQMFFTFFSRVFGARFCMSLVFSCLQGEKLLKFFNNEVRGDGEGIIYIGIRVIRVIITKFLKLPKFTTISYLLTRHFYLTRTLP